MRACPLDGWLAVKQRSRRTGDARHQQNTCRCAPLDEIPALDIHMPCPWFLRVWVKVVEQCTVHVLQRDFVLVSTTARHRYICPCRAFQVCSTTAGLSNFRKLRQAVSGAATAAFSGQNVSGLPSGRPRRVPDNFPQVPVGVLKVPGVTTPEGIVCRL